MTIIAGNDLNDCAQVCRGSGVVGSHLQVDGSLRSVAVVDTSLGAFARRAVHQQCYAWQPPVNKPPCY